MKLIAELIEHSSSFPLRPSIHEGMSHKVVFGDNYRDNLAGSLKAIRTWRSQYGLASVDELPEAFWSPLADNELLSQGGRNRVDVTSQDIERTNDAHL